MKKNISIIFVFLLYTLKLVAQCQVSIQITSPDCDSICNGSMQAFPNGTPPFTYMWSNGNTTSITNNLCASTQYTVTVTDSTGCVATSIATMYPVMQAILTIVSPPSCPTCCDGILQVASYNGSCAPYTYNWTPSLPPGATQHNICSGSYTACVINSCGCVRCDTQTVNSPSGILDLSYRTEFLYPQPFSDQCILQLEQVITDAKLEIYDARGTLVKSESNLTGSQIVIHRDALPPGLYFYRVSCKGGILFSGDLAISD